MSPAAVKPFGTQGSGSRPDTLRVGLDTEALPGALPAPGLRPAQGRPGASPRR